jgi:MFS family permease
LSVLLGVGWATLSWSLATWMYTRNTPNYDLMLVGGFGLALGFILSAILNLRGWVAVLLTAASIYLSLYAPFNNFCHTNYICPQSPGFSVAPAALIGLGVGAFAGVLLRNNSHSRRTDLRFPSSTFFPLTPPGQAIAGVLGGLIWALFAWGIYAAVWGAQGDALSWASVVGFVTGGIVTGALAAYLMPLLPRAAFITSAAALFIAILFMLNPGLVTVTGESVEQYGFAPQGWESLVYYDWNQPTLDESGVYSYPQLFTTGIPMALLIAIGGHFMALRRDVRLRVQQMTTASVLTPISAGTDEVVQVSPSPTATGSASKPISMMTTIIQFQEDDEEVMDSYAAAYAADLNAEQARQAAVPATDSSPYGIEYTSDTQQIEVDVNAVTRTFPPLLMDEDDTNVPGVTDGVKGEDKDPTLPRRDLLE